MNRSSRDSWTSTSPGQSNAARSVEQHSRSSGQPGVYGPPMPGPPVLPPPSSTNSSGPNLPAISDMPQASPNVISQRPQISPYEQNAAPQSQQHSIPQPSSNYAAHGTNAAAPSQPLPPPQPAYEKERETREARDREARERDYEQVRHEQQREREAREQQIRDRQQQTTPHRNHAEHVQLHQPVAVGPQIRSAIHGPNGLLNSGGGSGNANTPSSGPPSGGPVNIFSPQYERTPQAGAQASQLPVQNIIFQSGTPGIQQVAMPGVAPGQQPILNDALSYLDQVKIQFREEPNVYNQFLDIMKDFKSQAIDTPGVIRRVSQLFTGNPQLIQGFNTFLPPGYKIECGNPDDPNAIRVTTPMGTTVSPNGTTIPLPSSQPPPPESSMDMPSGPRAMEVDSRDLNGSATSQRELDHVNAVYSPSNRPRPGPAQLAQGQAESVGLGVSHGPSPLDSSNRPEQSLPVNAALRAHEQEQRGVSHLQNAVSVAAEEGFNQRSTAGVSPGPEGQLSGGANGDGTAQGAGGDKRGPVEFNHAINYVNKIKNRFSSQPEIYKQFLEILQTYQRESKPIQDVYAQVTQLFGEAPDLLNDFTQFLPESAAHARAAQAKQAAEEATTLSNMRGDYASQNSHSRHTPRAEQHRMPPIGNFAPTPSAGRDAKRKRGHGAAGMASSGAGTAGQDYAPVPNGKPAYPPHKRAKQTHQSQPTSKYQPQPDAPSVSPTLVPALPEPMTPDQSTTATQDEVTFFERTRKFINNKSAMNEFLKLCNLYSQDLIDKTLLVDRVQNFIGANTELYAWFKKFIKFDGRHRTIETMARPTAGRVNLNMCRALGQSYRELPRRERIQKCSGRDEMCNSVLNDGWVSHPTWASEDSGFIAHKKNVHEESLHRVEEERHDYDQHIQALERTIQLLTTYAHQCYGMTPEERDVWTLPPDFGGPARAIYTKMLTRIYGRQICNQMIEDLVTRPADAVPVILQRCKVHLEQWKACQREWDKIWREQTNKIFHRSLDHQGINVKLGDKRQFQTKTLQNEIQARFEEQKRSLLAGLPVSTRSQADYNYPDEDVLMDASRLLLVFAEQSHGTDYPKLLPFIKEFIPLFFGLPMDKFKERIEAEFQLPTPGEDDVDDEGHASEDSGQTRGRRMNGKRADLLRGVLERGRGGRSGKIEKDRPASSRSRASTPDVGASADNDMDIDSESDDIEDLKSEVFIRHRVKARYGEVVEIKANEPFKRNIFNLYANLPIYCFFRMFTILYERLSNLKQQEPLVKDTVRRMKLPKPADDLRMTDKHPDEYFQDTGPDANYYRQMLNMFEELLKADPIVEMAYLEDILRRFYLGNGWMLYSFDKMLSALVRFGIAVLASDNKERSSEILQLFTKDRKKDLTTHQDELIYRRQVERHVKEGDIYKIAYNQAARIASVRILKSDISTFDSSTEDGLLTPEQRWAYYVASYTSYEPTEGLQLDLFNPPFLNRNLQSCVKAVENSTSASNTFPGEPYAESADTNNLANEGSAPATDDGGSSEQALLQRLKRKKLMPNVPPKALAARLWQLRSKERLEVLISPDTYKISWPSMADGDQSQSEFPAEEMWVEVRELGGKGKVRKGKNSAEEKAGIAHGKEEPVDDNVNVDDEHTKEEDVAMQDDNTDPTQGKDRDESSINVPGESEPQSAHPEHSTVQSDHHAHDGEESTDDPAHVFEEKFVMNNAWMRGITRDEVAQKNDAFMGWVDTGDLAGLIGTLDRGGGAGGSTGSSSRRSGRRAGGSGGGG
ncbi:MAG: Transcriptional regulatory protein sin3 [Alyxoria varia]|nr:MAG: Transcriptional regulatory protein sin3 [Alyxoria varia]